MKIKIDSLGLMRALGKDKRRMALWLFVAAVLGVVVAFSIPRTYKSVVMLAPETTGSSMASSISSLASMVGIYGSNNMTGDAIYPEIYPEVVGAMRFRMGLFEVPVTTKDGTLKTDYYDYLKNHQRRAWWAWPAWWIGQMVQRLKASDDALKKGQKRNPLQPTREEYKVAMKVSDDVVCQVDKKTSVISITVEAQDPMVAATIANAAKERLQVFITNYRTNKARQDLDYMKKLFEEARRQYVNDEAGRTGERHATAVQHLHPSGAAIADGRGESAGKDTRLHRVAGGYGAREACQHAQDIHPRRLPAVGIRAACGMDSLEKTQRTHHP